MNENCQEVNDEEKVNKEQEQISEEENFLFDENNIEEILETLLILMDEYISENPTSISEPDFHETFIENVKLLFFAQFEYELKDDGDLEEDLNIIIDEALKLFYSTIIPERSLSESIILHKPDVNYISSKIEYLKTLPQPIQRTKEWYEFRRNLITASNAYKAFESQSSQNQLIYEKCCELEIKTTSSQININTPFHWGQKYEPLSVMIYEANYNTKIGDFGCIQHSVYSFLGASPDGINIDQTSERYGRMLEIKNIVNREIDGIPKKEYWIQMQLQMETCDLDECDFLETMFVEYEREKDFLEDGTFFTSLDNELKGIIMYFINSEGNPNYIYKPLDMDNEEFEEWEENNMDTLNMTWIKNIYWKLKICSCVLVQRNKKWFKDNIHQIENIWSIIEAERKSGFQHRAPNKRIIYDKNNNVENNITGCMIKIRTESIDETKEKIDI